MLRVFVSGAYSIDLDRPLWGVTWASYSVLLTHHI